MDDIDQTGYCCPVHRVEVEVERFHRRTVHRAAANDIDLSKLRDPWFRLQRVVRRTLGRLRGAALDGGSFGFMGNDSLCRDEDPPRPRLWLHGGICHG